MKEPVKYDLWEKNEYSYKMACGFIPNVRAYVHETDEKMPAMIVVPGGGYSNVADSEGEIVAEKFYNSGYQVFVLTYTTNLLINEPLKMQSLNDISRAVRMIRSMHEEFNVASETVAFQQVHIYVAVCVFIMKI